MSMITHEDQSILAFVTQTTGRVLVLEVVGDYLEPIALSRGIYLLSFEGIKFSDLPHVPGLCVWGGSIVVDDGDGTYNVTWQGSWRQVRMGDLP